MTSNFESKLIGLLWLLGIALVALVFAIGLPRLGKLVPWSVENHLAKVLQTEPTLTCTGRKWPKSLIALEKLKVRLYPRYPSDQDFNLNLDVIVGDTVNAFAVLGGHIYIYEGLLRDAESPDELAGVLAHEMEHVARRHIIQGVMVRLLTFESLKIIFSGSASDPSLFGSLLNLRFSRDQEREADEGGLQRLKDAQIDSQGFQHFFDRMQKSPTYLSLVSDHPADAGRSELASHYKTNKPVAIMTQDEWLTLKKICN